MRVLLIGPLFANAGHGAESGIYDALLRLGCEVFVWDNRVGKFKGPTGIRLTKLGDRNPFSFPGVPTDYDMVLCPGPGLPPKLHESRVLDLVTGTKVLWNSEAIRLPNYLQRAAAQKNDFDLICTFDESEIPLYQKLGCKNVMFLPQAFNPEWYRPLEDIEPSSDFCFVGSIGGKWSNRQMFLHAVHQICIRRGWTINAKSGLFDGHRVNEIYNYSKAVLNIGLYCSESGNPEEFRAFALQQRIFEAAGAGRVCVTHDVGQKTNQVFTNHGDILFYTGPNDLEFSMEQALLHWDDLSDNVMKSRHKHMYSARMELLLSKVT